MSKRRIGIIIAFVAMIPFSGLMFMMLGPVIVPSVGTLGASAACPAGYVGAYVKTWRSFDGRNSSDHWELECSMPNGATVPADGGTSYGILFATAAGTVTVLGAMVGAIMLAMTRRDRLEAARAREAVAEEEARLAEVQAKLRAQAYPRG